MGLAGEDEEVDGDWHGDGHGDGYGHWVVHVEFGLGTKRKQQVCFLALQLGTKVFHTRTHTHAHKTQSRRVEKCEGWWPGGCSGMGQTKQMQSAMCFAFAASEPPYWG